MVDKQGLTGSKVDHHSISCRSITRFSIETGGTFDLDAELKIWISGAAAPIQKRFNKKLSIYDVQAVSRATFCGKGETSTAEALMGNAFGECGGGMLSARGARPPRMNCTSSCA